MEYQSKDKCMTKQELLDKLYEDTVEVVFSTRDGSIRQVNVTLNNQYIGDRESLTGQPHPNSKYASKKTGVLIVWDTIADGWSKLRLDRVTKVNGEATRNGIF